jgi:hypothetical protein
MKKLLLLALLIVSNTALFSQITITDADMPSAGDTFRISNGLITPAIDPVPSGSNYTWDFSTLEWISQDVDSFVTVGSTSAVYSLVFANVPFNPYRSNMAARGPQLPAIPQVSLTDVFYFYYNTAASYQQSGYGAAINGFNTPIPFNNKDRIYDFPVDFGNMDSSDSDFQISIPGLGFYGHEQHRVNNTDGWGTLITPYGSFNTLRIKSDITANDSIYLDTLGIGFALPVQLTTEYKWLGQQEEVPLLQINTATNAGMEIITSIRYRDSLRTLTSLQEPIVVNEISSVYPNPSTGTVVIDLQSLTSGEAEISLQDISGRQVMSVWTGVVYRGLNKIVLSIDGISSGNYILEAVTPANISHSRLSITK